MLVPTSNLYVGANVMGASENGAWCRGSMRVKGKGGGEGEGEGEDEGEGVGVGVGVGVGEGEGEGEGEGKPRWAGSEMSSGSIRASN